MRAFLLLPYYIKWHYGRAIFGIMTITTDCIWFLWHYFSVDLQIQTLFSPFERLQEKVSGFDIGAWLSVLAINIIMRFVGALVRSVFIIIGLVSVLLTFVLGILCFLVWIGLPFVCLFLVVAVVVFIVKSS